MRPTTDLWTQALLCTLMQAREAVGVVQCNAHLGNMQEVGFRVQRRFGLSKALQLSRTALSGYLVKD